MLRSRRSWSAARPLPTGAEVELAAAHGRTCCARSRSPPRSRTPRDRRGLPTLPGSSCTSRSCPASCRQSPELASRCATGGSATWSAWSAGNRGARPCLPAYPAWITDRRRGRRGSTDRPLGARQSTRCATSAGWRSTEVSAEAGEPACGTAASTTSRCCRSGSTGARWQRRPELVGPGGQPGRLRLLAAPARDRGIAGHHRRAPKPPGRARGRRTARPAARRASGRTRTGRCSRRSSNRSGWGRSWSPARRARTGCARSRSRWRATPRPTAGSPSDCPPPS